MKKIHLSKERPFVSSKSQLYVYFEETQFCYMMKNDKHTSILSHPLFLFNLLNLMAINKKNAYERLKIMWDIRSLITYAEKPKGTSLR